MAASNIDALYAELYPQSPSGARGGGGGIASFDEDSPVRGSRGHGLVGQTSSSCGAQQQQRQQGNGFDSDEDDGEGNASAAQRSGGASAALVGGGPSVSTLNTVPFPNISHAIYDAVRSYYRCTQAFKGYVCGPASSTAMHGASDATVDEAERLRSLFTSNNTPQAAAALAKDTKLHTDLLRKKGAFHVVAPHRGNGCCDYTLQPPSGGEGGDDTMRAGAVGGCPFLICRKCDHPVVRHDGVRWFGSKLKQQQQKSTPSSASSPSSCAAVALLDEEAEPETNLYLVVRNYYPDWSRIATASIAMGATTASSSVYSNQVAAGSPTPLPSAVPSPPKKAAIDAFDDSDGDEGSDAVGSPSPNAATTADNLVSVNNVTTGGDSPSAAGASSYALVSDPSAAAYCCQCSWLTVTQTAVGIAITTTLQDTALYAHTPDDPSAITRFTAVIADGVPIDNSRYRGGAGGNRKRRLPLWVCKGHVQ